MKEFKYDDFECVTSLRYRVYEYDSANDAIKVIYEYKPKKVGYCLKLDRM